MARRVLTIVLALAATAAAGDVRFKKIVLDKAFRAEGVATADVNHDGKRDVMTGEVWYAAPDWTMHEQIKPGTYQPKGYSQCFNNWAADVNGDGWVDSIVVKWPGKEVVWRENPQNKPGHWKEHVIAKAFSGETPLFTDLLGTGKPVLLKRGISATVDELLLAAEYILKSGNPQVMLCLRGIRTFEDHTRFTLSLGTLAYLKQETHLPVIVDPSHPAGRRDLVPALARGAVAAGADGLLVEVHPDPERAAVDGAQSLRPEDFDALMAQLRPIAEAVGRELPIP